MSQTDTPSRRVLLVDDDPEMAELMAELLCLKGFAASWCVSSEEAIPLLDGASVLVTDMRLGRDTAGGLTLCRQARATASVEVVLVVSGDREAEEAALRSGADAFFTKPVDVDRLATAIRARLAAHP